MRNAICGLALAMCAGATAMGQNKSAQIPDIKMVEIPAGSFMMGSDRGGKDFDEAPVHKVLITAPFSMSATEITNRQYEQLFPEHKALRGLDGVSKADDEPVVNVSYDDALAFCHLLSEATGRNYRLPTEAEWEYACRAGTDGNFWTGDTLPAAFQRSQKISRDYDPVDLTVGRTEANAFGLHDMHGSVEEWCLDWYGAYEAGDQTNPGGPDGGEFRVTRGGSHHTPVEFLRSANRMAMLPTDRHSLTGFRIVESDTKPVYHKAQPDQAERLSGARMDWTAQRVATPVFMSPIPFVIAPDSLSGVPFYSHNHQPAITWCDNGDLLAIWFSANAENGREMVVLSSRFHPGAEGWTAARMFYKVPDRNMTGSSLLNDGKGTLYHFNGVEAAGDWQNLALVMRKSDDNGATWTPTRIIEPRHTKRHQVISGPIIAADGTMIQLCDAGPGSHDGTSIHLTAGSDTVWYDPWDGAPLPEFADGGSGTTIAGIHAGIVELADGTLLTLGRGNSITNSEGRKCMPMSRSTDRGKSWHYSASEFPPIDGGQRLILRRLNEGPILLVAFTDHPQRTPEHLRGMEFTDESGNKVKGYGMYAALSFDDGRTWPVKKLLTDGEARDLTGGAWTGDFTMDATHAEPLGYLAATQSPDGMIHLISSRLHYRFNLPWLLEGTVYQSGSPESH